MDREDEPRRPEAALSRRLIVLIAHDPRLRPRDTAAELDITERSAYAIVTEPTEAGYVVNILVNARKPRPDTHPSA